MQYLTISGQGDQKQQLHSMVSSRSRMRLVTTCVAAHVEAKSTVTDQGFGSRQWNTTDNSKRASRSAKRSLAEPWQGEKKRRSAAGVSAGVSALSPHLSFFFAEIAAPVSLFASHLASIFVHRLGSRRGSP